MKVVFLCPYPFDQAPSQRFRFEQYLGILQQKGYTYSWHSFYSLQGWDNLYKEGKFLTKSLYIVWGLLRRIFHLATITPASLVYLHREAAPIGPPIFEWIIAKVMRKKIIYDFDDAIWLTDRNDESNLEKALRWRSKVGLICKWSYNVSCGNEYLANYARKFTTNVIVNPTTINTDNLHTPSLTKDITQNDSGITIGWTGSHSTLKYLKTMEGTITKLQEKYSNLKFLVIADKKPSTTIKRLEFIHWQKETEVADLLKIDIGIMPLPDDEWTRGKCGFKALQYMAMGIPCVVSPVGVNSTIVDHEKTGFIATTENDWLIYLERLIKDYELRKSIGMAGRKKVVGHYSVSSNTSTFLSLFE
jgi:glycosyltransferase involved in cell wall biosynthesis